MTTTIKDIIQQHLETVRTGIVQRMQQRGRMASGKSAASLAITVSEAGGYLEGSKSFLSMERGRGPGKVPKNFTSIIKDWIIAKGISYQGLIPKNGNQEQGAMRLAGAIAHTIITKGTRLYRDNGSNDIYTELLNEEVTKMANETSGIFELEIDRIQENK